MKRSYIAVGNAFSHFRSSTQTTTHEVVGIVKDGAAAAAAAIIVGNVNLIRVGQCTVTQKSVFLVFY